MDVLRIFLQRRRKMLARLGALLVLGIGGMLAILPRADAHGADVAAGTDLRDLLLSPERLSGDRFAVFTAVTHR